MKTIDLKPSEMSKRIARFKDLKPYKQSIENHFPFKSILLNINS